METLLFKTKYFIILFLIPSLMSAQTLVNFKENPSTAHWKVVDDVVMGGRSSGSFSLSEKGYGKFFGKVSLENNGGFSSVRYAMETFKVNPKSSIRFRVKGDEKQYQFRLKHDRKAYYSYNTSFKTTGDWQTITVALADFKPTFRGRKVDLPNFDQLTIEELRFLIGNKKPQEFQLLIAYIEVL